MFKINPYRPGAGLMPVYLSGRDNLIAEAEESFRAIAMDIPVASIVYSGLRGVGKTVLINHLQQKAEEFDIFCRHIEVEGRNDFISQISTCAQAFLREASVKEKFKTLISKSLDAIKTLVVSFDPNSGGFSLSVQESALYKTSNLTQSMTDVFVSIGEVAQKTKTPVCFFIDEIQYMKQNELGSLIAALHRTNQLGYPVMIIGAGLPKIYKMLSEEKSYSERLFSYREVGGLNQEQTVSAVVEPARKFHVEYTKDATDKIFEITGGYPFFIQQFCQIIYNRVDEKVISLEDVENSIQDYYAEIDRGFFKVRYERCSATDKLFIFAMVNCDKLPCTISNVAMNLNKSVTSISTTRAQLINKGIIYPIRYKELDFTVPDFAAFIRRLDEYQEWIIEKNRQ